MKSTNKLYVWVLFAFIDIVAVFVAIGFLTHQFHDVSLEQKEKSNLIGASYMTMNNEYFKIISEEINSRIEAEGDRFIIRDPALSTERQVAQIREMIDMGIDVLIVNPVDWDSLSPVLREAKEKGVLTVVVDTNVSDENLIESTIVSDNYQAGKIIGDYFVSQNPTANLVLMTHNSAKSGQDRIQGFIDAISVNPEIKVVGKIECEGQMEIAMPELQKFIDSGVPFDSVFCLNDLASVGVVAALDDNGLLGEVKVYGVDASPDSKALIYEGMMEASIAQFPIEIGDRASETIYRLLNGEKVEKRIVVPVQLINRENVVDFGIERWQ